MDKSFLGYLSIVTAIAVAIPYLWKMRQGKLKPHIFTWVIWSLTTGIAAAARTTAHAGPGVWGQWASVGMCVSVVLFAFKRGEHSITRTDIFAFVAALSAIPAWLITQDPLIAVIIVTCIDVLGYYPTFRKSYNAPHHEAIFNYVVANIIHMLVLLATVEYSLTNILFPATIFCTNLTLIVFLMWRRRFVPVI